MIYSILIIYIYIATYKSIKGTELINQKYLKPHFFILQFIDKLSNLVRIVFAFSIKFNGQKFFTKFLLISKFWKGQVFNLKIFQIAYLAHDLTKCVLLFVLMEIILVLISSLYEDTIGSIKVQFFDNFRALSDSDQSEGHLAWYVPG